MGWSTELFCNITFNKETFNSRYEVETRIDELNNLIDFIKDRIKSFVIMTEPNKMLSEEERKDPLFHLSKTIKEDLEELEDYIIEKWKLEILLENWDSCHNENGLAINPPDEIIWKTAFLDGDFVKTIKYPNANDISEFGNE